MEHELVRGASTAHPLNVSYRIGKLGPIKGRWLDLGCADGGYSAALLDAGASEIYGIDVEADRVEEACKAVPGGHFQVAFSEELPYADNFFDGVWMNEVFEHVADERKTLAEIRRVLVAGGQLCVISPNRGFPFEGHEVRIGKWTSAVPTPLIPWLPKRLTRRWVTARNYWPNQLRGQVEEAGFRIAKTGFVMPCLELYSWLPDKLVAWYQRYLPTLDRMPVVSRFGVSNLVLGRTPGG